MKNTPDDQLMDVIRERMNHHKEEPDELVWKMISQEESRRRPFAILSSALLITLMTLTLGQSLLTLDKFHIDVQAIDNFIPREKENTNSISSNTSVSEKSSVYKSTAARTRTPDILKRNSTRVGINNIIFSKYKQSNKVNPDSSIRFFEASNEMPALPSPPGALINLPIEFIKIDTIKHDTVKTESNKKERKRRGVVLYAMIGPSLSYHGVNPLRNDELVITKLISPTVLSKQRLGINVDVGLQKSLSDLWEIYGGLSYRGQNQTITYEYISPTSFETEVIPGSNSYLVKPIKQSESFEYSIRNVGAQVGGIYKLNGKKLMQKVGFGFSYEHGLSKLKTERGYDNSKSTYLNGVLFYRSEYQINSQTSFIIQPSFTQSLFVDENMNEPLKVRPYYIQMSFGFVRNF